MKHLFLFSGLGADHRVFQFLDLSGFKVTYIKWLEPLARETMQQYAARLTAQIDVERPVLVGLSFGGMRKLASLGARTVTAGLETIATYLLTENRVTTDRDKKMEQVYRFDHRLGLWVDAAIVERAWGLTVGPPSSEDGRNIISCVRLLARSKTISKKQWRRLFARGQKADVIGDAYNEELLRSESYLAENAHVLRVEKMVDETYGIGVIGTTAAMGVADVWWRMDPDQPDRDLDRDSTEWAESEARASKELEKAAFNAVLSYPWYDRQTP